MSRWRALRHVILPQLTPYLFAAARSGLALIWKIVLVVELLGRSNGVGFQIQIYFQLFDVTLILAYTLAFILVAQSHRMGRGATSGTLGDTMAEVILRLHIERKSFHTNSGELPVLGAIDLALGAARDCCVGRPIGLRQDHDAADHRRSRYRVRGNARLARRDNAADRHRVSGAAVCCLGGPFVRTSCWPSGQQTRSSPTSCCFHSIWRRSATRSLVRCRLAWHGAWPSPAHSRSSRSSCCWMNHSSRSTRRWPRAAATCC